MRPGKGNYRPTEGNSRLIVGAVTGRSRTVTTHSLTNSGRMPPLDAEPAQPTGVSSLVVVGFGGWRNQEGERNQTL